MWYNDHMKTAKNPKGAGRKTTLSKKLFVQIKNCALEGMNLQTTADTLGIPRDTLYGWSSDNYLDFNKNWKQWEKDYELSLAGTNIKKVLKMNTLGLSEREDHRLLKIQADVSMWVKETLDKDDYSKRTEIDISTVEERVRSILHD